MNKDFSDVYELRDYLDDKRTQKAQEIWKGTEINGYYIGLKYAVIRLSDKCVKVDLDTAQIVSIWDI